MPSQDWEYQLLEGKFHEWVKRGKQGGIKVAPAENLGEINRFGTID